MSKFKMLKQDKIVTGIVWGVITLLCVFGGIYAQGKTKYDDLVQNAQSKIESSTKEILGQKYDDIKVENFTNEKQDDNKIAINCMIGINGNFNKAKYIYNIVDGKTIELSNKDEVNKNLQDMLVEADKNIQAGKETDLQVRLTSFVIKYMDNVCPINETMKYGASFLDKVKTNSDGTIQYKLTLKVTETNQYNAKMNYKAIFVFNVKSDFSDYDLVDYYAEK